MITPEGIGDAADLPEHRLAGLALNPAVMRRLVAPLPLRNDAAG